jgi:predicted nuclease with TOPRIM domain
MPTVDDGIEPVADLPVARTVRDNLDIDKRFEPVTREDVDDEAPAMLANHMRALQREMRDGFDSIGRALQALSRIEERLVVVIDRQNHLERRIDDHERRLALLEKPIVVEVAAPLTVRDVVPRAVVVRKRTAKGPRKKR